MATQEEVKTLCEKLHSAGIEALREGNITPFVSWNGNESENLAKYAEFEGQTTTAMRYRDGSLAGFHDRVIRPVQLFSKKWGEEKIERVGKAFPTHSTLITEPKRYLPSLAPDNLGTQDIILLFDQVAMMGPNLVVIASYEPKVVTKARLTLRLMYKEQGLNPTPDRDVVFPFITVARIADKLSLAGYREFAEMAESCRMSIEHEPLYLAVSHLETTNLWLEMRR